MSQELIYTSAPRGLKPGSHGFCTVVNTQGISTSLVQRLEALSGYRHAFPPQDPNARLNPVLFSHLIISMAGRPCHVLSRVCDAGLDHTQRTNKFAHHVVLDPRETSLASGGPAQLLAAPGFMQSTWDGVPRVLPTGRRPPTANSPATVCRAWQKITGDAGWGGVLAETASPASSRPAIIVYRPGVDVLPLLAESLALLPPEIRWNVSFCTYFSKLPPGIDCQWRCVLEGSPEAVAAQRLAGALVIELGKPLGAAPSSGLVQAARSGVAPTGPAPAARQPAIAGAYRPNDAELSRLLGSGGPVASASPAAGSSPAAMVAPPVAASAGDAVYDLGPPPLAQSSADSLPQGQPRKLKRKPMSKWPVVGGLAATVAIVVLGVVGMRLANNKPSSTQVAAAPELQPPSDGKSSGDTPKTVNTADAGKAKQAEKPKGTEEQEEIAKLKDTLVAYEHEATIAWDDARKAYDDAKTACENAKAASGKPDASEADSNANVAVAAARQAEENATKASKIAKDAATSIKALTVLLGKPPPSEAQITSAVKGSELCRNDAKACATDAKKYAEQAIAAVGKTNEARDREMAISSSLKGLNNLEVPILKCKDKDAAKQVEIGPISGFGIGSYRLDLIGKDAVLPKGFTIDIAEKSGKDPTWKCLLTIPGAGGDSKAKGAEIMSFSIHNETLYAKWETIAGNIDYYKYSDQMRNCMLRISTGLPAREHEAFVILGRSEPAKRLNFKISDKDHADRKELPTSLVVDRAIAIEPLETKIISPSGKLSWPVNVIGSLPDKTNPTPREQEWKLLIGNPDKAIIEFSLVGRKQPGGHDPVTYEATLKYEKDDQRPIEKKNLELEEKTSDLKKAESSVKDAKKDERNDREVAVNKLKSERDKLTNELSALQGDLNELRDALKNRPLKYRLLLIFSNKNRVLYSTEEL
jgi:hypothetical protein